MQTLDLYDWIAIGVYFLVLAGIAVWVIRKKNNTTEDYFLAGRNVGWFVVGASIFASNVGSEHVVGLAGAGAGDKLPMLIYEIQAWVVLMLEISNIKKGEPIPVNRFSDCVTSAGCEKCSSFPIY